VLVWKGYITVDYHYMVSEKGKSMEIIKWWVAARSWVGGKGWIGREWRILGQQKYSVWFYNDGYTSYIFDETHGMTPPMTKVMRLLRNGWLQGFPSLRAPDDLPSILSPSRLVPNPSVNVSQHVHQEGTVQNFTEKYALKNNRKWTSLVG